MMLLQQRNKQQHRPNNNNSDADAADRIEQRSCMDNFVQHAELFAENLQQKT